MARVVQHFATRLEMNDMWMAGVKTEAELQAHLVMTIALDVPQPV